MTTFSVDAVARYNPRGVMIYDGLALRWFQEDEQSPLARGRYAQLGATVGLCPAYAQGSIAGEWLPIAPLQLRLQYDAFGYFGANAALLRFPSPSSKFGDEELAALHGSEQAGIGHRVMLNPVLRARIGWLILRSQTDLAWYVLSRSSGWYYEPEYDTLLAERDWLAANRTVLMGELWHGTGDTTFLVGPMYEFTRSGTARIVRERVGATAYWAPAARWLGLDRPRVYALAGVNLVDRNRQGEIFAVLGFGGDVDLGTRTPR